MFLRITININHRVGERSRDRTYNLAVKSRLLYRLSYAPSPNTEGIIQSDTRKDN